MKSFVRLLAVAAVCLLAFAAPASAQYMFLDVNGDGASTAADILTTSSTGFDIWLKTDTNKDGSPAVCDTGDGELTINSYEFFVKTTSGAVTYGTWTDNMGYTITFGDFQDASTAYHGRGSGTITPGGTFKLGRLALSGVSADAVIDVVGSQAINPPGYTSFGTACSGNDFDNTYKFGSDWFDVDGTKPGSSNQKPVITAPATASGAENSAVSITGTANDPDADNVTLSQTNDAPFLAGPASAGPVLNPSITLTGTPSFTQSGGYTVNWSANDGAGGTAVATTALTIADVNRNPVITAPATTSGSENSAVSVTGSATDPDGDNIQISQTNNAAFLTGPASAGPALNPSITLTGTPSFAQSGSYTVNWSALDFIGGTATATTALTIADVNRNPVITAPATASGTENTAVSITGSATDPDGQNVTLSQTNDAAFLAGAASAGPALNPSITLTGTPSSTQSGAYQVNWTANDGAGGTAAATTALTVANLNQNPVITAPTSASGATGVSTSETGSASDPDAQTVTLSQTNDAPFFTASSSAGPSLNPSITLTGTPAAPGSFTINWSANDGAGGTAAATTALTITSGNQTPEITAPATVSGTENTAVSITGSATDPDANQVTLSQTNNAGFLTGPASAGPSLNPSITLTGTPSFTQSGGYSINWSALDNGSPALTGTAVTALTIENLNRNPVITAPATASGVPSVPVSVTGSASDPDAESVTLSQTNNAPFFTGSSSAGPSLNPSITLTGTPSTGGSFTIDWSATDASAGTAAATTVLTIGEGNQLPVITAPATASGTENSLVSITGSATDPDAENVTLSQTNNAAFLTGPASDGPSLNPSITLTGTPSFTQSGSYTINWSAVDASAGSSTATTALTIANLNRDPVITAPATASGTENSLVSITGSASDPDGENVTLSQTSDAPFLPAANSDGPSLNPTITLSGTPAPGQAGSYTINWSAVDETTGTAAATTALTVTPAGNQNPVITAPATASGTEGSAVSITGSASDPDGDNVTLSQTNNAAFLSGSASDGPSLNPSITLSGTPGPSDAGSYTVNWSAADATTGTAAATTALTIADQTQAPTLDQPADMTVNEGDTATQQLTGSDPDNDPLTFSKVGATPVFMSVSATGLVTLSPGFSDAGSYTGTARVSDGTLSDTKSFGITVVNQNRCPTANAGGPYLGVVNVPVAFNGSASSDPDGDTLTYNWSFGDGSNGSGATVTHSYAAAGAFTVVLTVNDGVCDGTATTTATISSEFPANAFTTGGNNTTSLNAGKPYTCVQIEPMNDSFNIADVNLASIKMISVGTGSVSEISADGSKSAVDGDKNHNGIDEVSACFTKADLRLLFSSLPAGKNTVTVALVGDLVTGGSFRATIDLVVKTSGALAASVSPNPLNPETTLSFNLSTPGRVTIKVFDVNGRLVRSLLDDTRSAGYQDVRWNGTNGNGTKVASGIYYFRLDTPAGREVKAVTVLK